MVVSSTLLDNLCAASKPRSLLTIGVVPLLSENRTASIEPGSIKVLQSEFNARGRGQYLHSTLKVLAYDVPDLQVRR